MTPGDYLRLSIGQELREKPTGFQRAQLERGDDGRLFKRWVHVPMVPQETPDVEPITNVGNPPIRQGS